MRFEDLKNIDIDTLPLNNRYKLGCKEAGILTVYDLMCYDKDFGQNLVGCGRKGVEELDMMRIMMFHKIDDWDKQKVVEVFVRLDAFPILKILSAEQLMALDMYFHKCVESVKNRMARERMKRVDCVQYINVYQWGTKKILRGIEVTDELHENVQNIKGLCLDYICRLFEYDVSQVKNEANVEVCMNCSSKMLYKLQDYIRYRLDKTERNIHIFLYSYHIFDSYIHLNYNEIAEKYSLTYERVRGISNDNFDRLFVHKKEFSDRLRRGNWDEYLRYLVGDRRYLKVSHIHDVYQQMRFEEHCDFSEPFLIYVLSCLLRDSYTLFNGFALHKFTCNPYLISNDVLNVYDESKCDDVLKEAITKNVIGYTMSIFDFIEEKLAPCLKKEWVVYRLDIAEILKDKLWRDYGIEVYEDNLITVPIGSKVLVIDVLCEIMERVGKPMHIDELFERFKKEWPKHHYTKPMQLKSALLKDDRVVNLGNTSRYALSKWHNINTKTIRENIHDLLMVKYTPQSLNKIYNYIVKDCGGMTSVRSLQTSLSLSNMFEAYEGNLWGLRDKRYPARFHKSQKMNGK